MLYLSYLQSEHWQRTRKKKLKKHRHCEFCSSTGRLDVHHKTYERRGRERLSDLVVLCRSCHDAVHDYAKAHPSLSLAQATDRVRPKKKSKYHNDIRGKHRQELRQKQRTEHLATVAAFDYAISW